MERRLNRRRFANPQEQAAFIVAEALKNNKNAKLERVLGCTACPSSFSHDPTTGIVAYAAGSTVVILGKNNTQSHVVNNSKNNITCLAFSNNGKYLATGEFGSDPMVRIWEIPKDGPFNGKLICELKGHTLGINCVKFTNDSTKIISVGNQHDKSVVVWNWKEQKKVAENRLTSPVNSMDIAYDGKSFVTVGVRHVKFWFLGESERALNGRSAILADQRSNTFLSVCCVPGNRTFAITDTRTLVEFQDKKIVNSFEMTGDVPHSIAAGPDNYLLIGFSNGIIRGIHTETFEVMHLVGKPHFLYHDVSTASDYPDFYQSVAEGSTVGLPFPDVRSIIYYQKSNMLTVLYSDRSIYQWSLSKDFRQSLIHGFRNHVGPIMDLEMIPVDFPWLSGGTFVTSGVDATIRFWNFEKENSKNHVLKSNILSSELKKILFITNDVKLFKDNCDNNGGMIFNDGLDSTTGAKCLKLKYNGTQLAAGFKDGNLGIFDITTLEFKKIAWIEAHDGEILCIEYSDPRNYNSVCILATGGRDRLIHLFDGDNYNHIQSVEDHSSSVNSVKFIPNPVGFEMFTCGTDKLVVIRRLTVFENGNFSLERRNQFNSPSGLNYLTTGPDDTLLFACQDRQIRTFTVNGKIIKQIKGTLCEEGTLTKLALDPSGTYAATVCSDRYVYLIDVATGECAAVLNGQSDSVTAIAFTPDCRRLVVVSYSGCVFVWRLSNMLTKKMIAKLGKAESAERCTTPDSVIESGSDSASIVGKKERSGLTASGSEFGSLTSVTIGNDDDLDSGVGGTSRNPVIDFETKDSSQFEIRRLPQEVVRRSSSSFLNIPDFDSESTSPQLDLENSQMLSSHQQPNSYAASRSMSSLHRSNASPQRIRRKWNDVNPVNSADFSNSQINHVYQQPNPISGISNSVSLHGLRNYSNYESPVATSTPKNSYLGRSGLDFRNQIEDSFNRSNSSRNSLTKKFMNLGTPTSPSEAKNVWTPPKYDSNRRPSGLFNNSLNGGHGIHRRQSERPFPVSTNMSNENSGMMMSRRLFQNRNNSNIAESDLPKPQLPSISIQMRTKKVDRKNRGRITMSDCYDVRSVPGVSSPLSPGPGLKSLQEEDYELSNLHLKSRSQSPSSLMLNFESENSRSRTNLRNPSDVGIRITPSSSRSNLRSASTTLSKSSQALNKMLEAREKLKKSQENLSIQIGEDSESTIGSSTMARSKSIGNLKFNIARGHDSAGYDGLSDVKRQMARSVTSLHNGGDEENFQHPDDVTLENQYAGGSRRPSTSRLADSIKNLQKLSNPDLTNENLYSESQSGFNLNESTSSSNNAVPGGSYYTLPKNLRNKGPVSKRVHKVTAVRIDQTSESDSNTSDQTPNNGFNGSYIKGSSGGSGFLRQNGPSRSSSSVEQGRVSAARRAFEPVPIRKPVNYLAQKINQQDRMDFTGPDTGPEEPSPRSTSSSEVPMSDERSKKMAMHLYECIEQFNTACDKILGARQLIDNDNGLSSSDREKLLRLVNKSIIQGRNRLEGLDSSRTVSSVTGGSTTSMSSKIQSSSPEPKIQIDNNFMNTYGPQIMQLLQQNMAKQN